MALSCAMTTTLWRVKQKISVLIDFPGYHWFNVTEQNSTFFVCGLWAFSTSRTPGLNWRLHTTTPRDTTTRPGMH